MSDDLNPQTLDWGRIDHVLLDMDGTLLDLHFDSHFWREHLPLHHAALRGLELEAARSDLYARYEAVRGRREWYCLDFWARELGLDIVALKREVRDRIALREGVAAFLAAVRSTSGRRVLLVTNAHRSSLDLKLEHTNIAGHFDRIVVAHDLGAPKEDPAFWPRLAAIEPFDPARTLFIDDNIEVLRAARDYGIAYLRAVSRPDSGREPVDTGEFAAVEDFAALARECVSGGPRS